MLGIAARMSTNTASGFAIRAGGPRSAATRGRPPPARPSRPRANDVTSVPKMNGSAPNSSRPRTGFHVVPVKKREPELLERAPGAVGQIEQHVARAARSGRARREGVSRAEPPVDEAGAARARRSRSETRFSCVGQSMPLTPYGRRRRERLRRSPSSSTAPGSACVATSGGSGE